jgi:hypothetical protein
VPPPFAAALAAAAAAQLGGAGAGRILEREARKSALFTWLRLFLWGKTAPEIWVKVSRRAQPQPQAACKTFHPTAGRRLVQLHYSGLLNRCSRAGPRCR